MSVWKTLPGAALRPNSPLGGGDHIRQNESRGIRGSHRGTPHRSSTCANIVEPARENQIQLASARSLRHTRGDCVVVGEEREIHQSLGIRPSERLLQKPILKSYDTYNSVRRSLPRQSPSTMLGQKMAAMGTRGRLTKGELKQRRGRQRALLAPQAWPPRWKRQQLGPPQRASPPWAHQWWKAQPRRHPMMSRG